MVVFFVFLVACTQLYKPLRRSVGRSVGPSLIAGARDLWLSALLMLYASMMMRDPDGNKSLFDFSEFATEWWFMQCESKILAIYFALLVQ